MRRMRGMIRMSVMRREKKKKPWRIRRGMSYP
jgi:hypothetical protein